MSGDDGESLSRDAWHSGPLARWEAVNVAARQLGLTSRERVLLSEIARRDGGAPGHCHASQTRLATDLGWHRQRVSEAHARLVAKGAVEIVGQRRRCQVVRFPWWRFAAGASS